MPNNNPNNKPVNNNENTGLGETHHEILEEKGVLVDKQTGSLIATYTKNTLHYP